MLKYNIYNKIIIERLKLLILIMNKVYDTNNWTITVVGNYIIKFQPKHQMFLCCISIDMLPQNEIKNIIDKDSYVGSHVQVEYGMITFAIFNGGNMISFYIAKDECLDLLLYLQNL
jgi:hypothetical protein